MELSPHSLKYPPNMLELCTAVYYAFYHAGIFDTGQAMIIRDDKCPLGVDESAYLYFLFLWYLLNVPISLCTFIHKHVHTTSTSKERICARLSIKLFFGSEHVLK